MVPLDTIMAQLCHQEVQNKLKKAGHRVWGRTSDAEEEVWAGDGGGSSERVNRHKDKIFGWVG